jgi:hypothetical protein
MSIEKGDSDAMYKLANLYKYENKLELAKKYFEMYEKS